LSDVLLVARRLTKPVDAIVTTSTPPEIRKTACNRDCPDACGIIATIQDGRVIRLQGDPDHPITQGFLCHRTSRFLERQYDPDRLTTPLVRQAGKLVPASWDQALDQIAKTMLRIRSEFGGEAIMHYRCGGSMGMMKHVSDYFFAAFGPATSKSGDICTGAGDAAQMKDFGQLDSHDLFDVLNSKTIVLWGKNPYVSQVHLLPILRKAKAQGTRIVLIDPIRHRTADLSDLYLQPKPGGDIALAFGVAKLLFERNQFDPAARQYCDHFDAFRALAESQSVEAWSEQAGLTAKDVVDFATEYAHGPTSILVGWGMQRRRHGSAAIRSIDALAAISGNLGIAGGGVSFYYSRRGAFDFSFADNVEKARTIPEPLLGPGILAASDPPIRMVWVTAANPVAMLPESKTVAKALESRELTVVVDSFLTDSASCADIVLPTTTMLEEDDLLGAYGHHWLIESRSVVAPPEGVLTDYEIVQQLAQRVGGMGEEFSDDVDTWKRRLLRRVADHGASLEDLRKGSVRNPLSQDILFADHRFPTPTGRVNLIHQIAPFPPAPPLERPLLLTSLSTEQSQGSQWVNGALNGPLTATVHPAAAVGFSDGEQATVESEIGKLTVRLKFDAQQRPDVLLIPKGGWLRNGHCSNALIPARLTDAGECAVYYDTPIRILKHDADPVNEHD
jgi:anaerobic selenocysteine-containing dehydrogenase